MSADHLLPFVSGAQPIVIRHTRPGWVSIVRRDETNTGDAEVIVRHMRADELANQLRAALASVTGATVT